VNRCPPVASHIDDHDLMKRPSHGAKVLCGIFLSIDTKGAPVGNAIPWPPPMACTAFPKKLLARFQRAAVDGFISKQLLHACVRCYSRVERAGRAGAVRSGWFVASASHRWSVYKLADRIRSTLIMCCHSDQAESSENNRQ
jgi:hypothetical protein